ncbi:hypothetical protein [Laspinema olomoucense]|nr:hypothetical protein [Laspinema sp. D3a]MCT7991998.1 hypothetical protein [Laspinema sp. D3a]
MTVIRKAPAANSQTAGTGTLGMSWMRSPWWSCLFRDILTGGESDNCWR